MVFVVFGLGTAFPVLSEWRSGCKGTVFLFHKMKVTAKLLHYF